MNLENVFALLDQHNVQFNSLTDALAFAEAIVNFGQHEQRPDELWNDYLERVARTHPDVQSHLKAGLKIPAIKALRNAVDGYVSLLEAKNAVEAAL